MTEPVKLDGISRGAIARALDGDPSATSLLVEVVTPVVRRRAARVRSRIVRRDGGEVIHDLDDLAQEAFRMLFEEDAKALRSWDPALGLSFANFVGLLTERRLYTLLRPREGGPGASELFADVAPDRCGSRGTPESEALHRELLTMLRRKLGSSLSERGARLFEQMFLREASNEEIQADTGLTMNALYQWRRRLTTIARGELLSLNMPSESESE